MKIFPFVLAGSLLANVGLAVVLFRGAAQREATANRAAHAAAAAEAVAKQTATSASTTGSDVGPDTWNNVRSDALPALIERLRREGFPPGVIRAIITAQVQESFRSRSRALNPNTDQPFWKPVIPDPKTRAAQQAIFREQNKLLKELLGSDPNDVDPYRAAMNERQFGHLPPEKVEQIRSVQEAYDEKRSAMFSQIRGSFLPDEAEKMRTIEREMRADMASLLTPAEFEEYELRGSNTANQMRYELTAFDATEEEFKILFRLRQPFEERFSYNYGMPPRELMQQRSEAEKVMNEQIKAALGPQRAADYERTTDSSYRQTTSLVSRLQLPPETTDQVYAVQKDFQRRIDALNTNAALGREERNQQLSAMNEEAKARLSSALTPRGFEAYRQNGGWWLQNLQPRVERPDGVPRARE